MNAIRLPDRGPSRPLIEIAIETHGPLRVLLAALRALLRPRVRPPDPRHGAVPDHLRRDVGLTPLDPPLPSQRGLPPMV